MKKIEILKKMLKESISINDFERKEILNFWIKNPEKIDKIIDIFKNEKSEILNILENYK